MKGIKTEIGHRSGLNFRYEICFQMKSEISKKTITGADRKTESGGGNKSNEKRIEDRQAIYESYYSV